MTVRSKEVSDRGRGAASADKVRCVRRSSLSLDESQADFERILLKKAANHEAHKLAAFSSKAKGTIMVAVYKVPRILSG